MPALTASERFAKIISSSWRRMIASISARWKALAGSGQFTRQTVSDTARQTILTWPDIIQRDHNPTPPPRSYIAPTIQSDPRYELIPQLTDLSSMTYKVLSDVIQYFFDSSDPFKSADLLLPLLIEYLSMIGEVGETRAALIARTEITRAAALAQLTAWGNDPDRDLYEYLWIPTHDRTTKDVSLKFEQEGPYTWWRLKQIWEVDHHTPQYVYNRHTHKWEYQTSVYNCRCRPGRRPKSSDTLIKEGRLQPWHATQT